MYGWEVLPDTRIEPAGPFTRACLARGLGDFRSLARRLGALPYGRAADRARYADVLAAGRGTCSTKHAFLAAAAAETGLPVALCLGLYEMDERNTPGVGRALEAGGLACVPEAHCYVRFRGLRVDLTRARVEATERIHFLAEEQIEPDQIGDYKVAWHRRHLRAWCATRGQGDWQRVWAVRETCIAALSEPTDPSGISRRR